MTATTVKHPAKYSKAILPVLENWIDGSGPVLDPMAGTGRLASIDPYAYLNELEPEWADLCRETYPSARVTCGDARHMPYDDGDFLTICTSPTYGNRMADHHNAAEKCRACKGTGWVDDPCLIHDPDCRPFSEQPCPKCDGKGSRTYKRNTYRHVLGRPLTEGSTGAMQWGPAYRKTHVAIWKECHRVLRPGGRLILNISNHIRKDVEVDVTMWHGGVLGGLGFRVLDVVQVETPRNGHGANGKVRVPYESVLLFEKVG